LLAHDDFASVALVEDQEALLSLMLGEQYPSFAAAASSFDFKTAHDILQGCA